MAAISTTVSALKAALVTRCLLWPWPLRDREEASMQEKMQLTLGQGEQSCSFLFNLPRTRAFSLMTLAVGLSLTVVISPGGLFCN